MIAGALSSSRIEKRGIVCGRHVGDGNKISGRGYIAVISWLESVSGPPVLIRECVYPNRVVLVTKQNSSNGDEQHQGRFNGSGGKRGEVCLVHCERYRNNRLALYQ